MFQSSLLSWYHQNKRRLPWRETNDPYKIWLSEVILQQTRVNQGIKYYEHFISEYPDVYQLANAPEDRVLNSWQGLGYYSRAKNLHATAKEIVKNFNGKFPETSKELLKLKGIGPYTAAAIASICFDEEAAVLDGNVYRVLARYFGIDAVVDSHTGKKHFAELASGLIRGFPAGTYNQAIMEFGALQCKVARPSCSDCPLRYNCYAHAYKKVDDLPNRKPKKPSKDRFLNYLVFGTNGDIILKKRGNRDIWRSLYDFPLLESDKLLSWEEIQVHPLFDKYKPLIQSTPPLKSKDYLHKLTHQLLHLRFFTFPYKQFRPDDYEKELILASKSDLALYPVPRVIEKFLEENKYL